MKKLFVVAFAVVALVIATPQKAEAAYSDGAALGFGGGGGYMYSGTWNGFITGQFPGVPIMFGLGWGSHGITVTGDKWMFNPNLLSAGGFFDLDFYLGVGVSVGFGGFGHGYFDLSFGARVPIGLSWRFFERFEIFTEIVPKLDLLYFRTGDPAILKLIGIPLLGGGNWENPFGVVGNIGFRFWF